MEELSIFVDESGSDSLQDRYYIVTLVLHEQKNTIQNEIHSYEQSLQQKNLPDIPLHTTPLLYRKKDYKDLSEATRKRLLSTFRVFFRHLPIRYICLKLKMREFSTTNMVMTSMRRKLIDIVFDNLEYFQKFDSVKIYYDNGQHTIAHALHCAIDYALSKNTVIYRMISASSYRLSQIADYICTVELAATRYYDKTTTATDNKFFGSWVNFKKGILKEVRAKQL